jgi:hypothetical protein
MGRGCRYRWREGDVTHGGTIAPSGASLKRCIPLACSAATKNRSLPDDSKTRTIWRYSLAGEFDRDTLLKMLEPAPF